MTDAKSLFDDLKKRLEPRAYRWRKPAAADAVPQREQGEIWDSRTAIKDRKDSPPADPVADIDLPSLTLSGGRDAGRLDIPEVGAAAIVPPAEPQAQGDVAGIDLAEIEKAVMVEAGAEQESPTEPESAPEQENPPEPAEAPVEARAELAAEGDAVVAEAEAAPAPAPAAPQTLTDEVFEALAELKDQTIAAGERDDPKAAFEAMNQGIRELVEEIEARELAAAEPVVPVPDGETAEAGAAPQRTGGNLLADVRAVAAGWFRNGRAADGLNKGAGDVPMPEELTAAAADRGVDVHYAEKPLAKLTDKDFPCIALDKQGGSHILVGKPDAGTVLTQDKAGTRPVGLQKLQEILSGVVFFIRPKPTEAAEPKDAAGKQVVPDKPGLFGIFGTVSRELFATQKPMLWQLGLATVLSNLFTFVLPLFSMAIYDRVVPHLAWETLWALSIGVIIVLAADFALRYIRMKLLDSVGLTTATTLQSRLFSRIVHGRMMHVPTASGGVANGMREVEALCHVIPSLIVALLVDIPFFLMAMVLIYSIAGMVAVTPLLGALALAAIHVFSHLGEDAARKHSRFVGTQTNALLETMGTLETVKLTGAERMLLRRWERLVDAASYASHLNRLQGNFSSQASIVVAQAVTVLAMIIGVYEISTGAMTIGAMSASVLLIGRMMTPVSQLMTYLHRAHQLSSSAQMMDKILAIPQETAGDSSETREETPIVGHIAFRNVSFTYAGEQAPCLEGITLDIRPGEKVGLIGRVGSGKSTLLRLMLQLHQPTTGTILLDGQDVRQHSPRALRRAFGFMRQDSVLFDDTLQANICFGLDVMRPADFERAVTLTGVKDFAARNPAGFGMRVGSRGERLSGGERQSVSLARLLTESPMALVMDEPTSAMDNALEAKIVRELREVVVDKTLIVATHRAPLLGLVDRIIWMEGGRIVADGPKSEVMQKLSQAAA